MQWIIVLLVAIFAAAAEDSHVMWIIIAFVAGYLVNLRQHFQRLQKQLDFLSHEIARLKKQAAIVPTPQATVPSIHSPPVIETTELPATLAKEVAEPEEIPEPETLPPLVFPSPEKPVFNPWLSEPPPLKKDNLTAPQSLQTEPSDSDKVIQFIWRWFTDGNTFVRVGIVILFIGVSFLLNLAIEQGFIPIELRLCAVAMGAIGLLAIGWRLKERVGGYGLLIQGSGVGVLYLTIFVSYNLYQVLPASVAFLLLILIVGLSATLAVLENAVSLALFGAIGGFLAPILTASGNHNHITLFSFYALLNAGIFAIAWFKAWRILNLVGFGFTLSIGAFWGIFSYQPEFFLSSELFLLLFFLFYVAIGILYATRRAPDFKDIIDGTLIFGTPILAFALQAGLVKDTEYGVATSAFVLGGFYLALAWWVWSRLGKELKFLSEALLAVGVIFITLAIPFAVDELVTCATWAAEGTGVLWVSIRQQQRVRRLFALALQLLAGITLLSEVSSRYGNAFFNGIFIGVLLISGCAGLSSWLLANDFVSRRNFEKNLSPWLLAYSLIWLFLGFDLQIEVHDLKAVQNDLMLSLTFVSTLVLTQLGICLSWKAAKTAALAMIIPLVFGAFVTSGVESHPSAGNGVFLWPLAFVAYFYGLKTISAGNDKANLSLHLFTGLFLCALLWWEGVWQLLLFTSLISLLFNYLANTQAWQQARTLAFGLLPVMLLLSFCCLFSSEAHPFVLPDISSGVSWSFEAGYLLWTVAFAVLYWLFYDADQQKLPLHYLATFHCLTLLLAVALLTWEASWHLSNQFVLHSGWFVAFLPILTIAALWLIMQPPCWPFTRYQQDYIDGAAPLLRWGLILWSVMGLKFSATAAPLPWLPLLNPAEIMQLIVLLTLGRFEMNLSKTSLLIDKRCRYRIFMVFGFIWLNVVLLRTVHHWGNLPWSAQLFNFAITQTCLSIFWTLCGLTLAIIATRKQRRGLWIAGASLLTVVVLKLFTFDLHAHGSMERIISFITVGILLMLIGYFAPLPPKVQDKNSPL